MDMLADRETRGLVRAGVPEALQRRLKFLAPDQRKMVEMAASGVLSRREMALLTGLSNGTVTRRLRRIVTRLNDRLVGRLVDEGALLPELYREVGLAFFLRRMRQGDIARELGMSVYEVRRVVTYLRGWNGGAGSSRR